MANEAALVNSLHLVVGYVDYRPLPTSFYENVTGSKGPCPGAFTASVEGTDVDFSQLTTPGLCRIINLDTTNSVDVGIWDPETSTFYPYQRIHPGKSYVIYLSPDLQEQYGTGTGTTGANTNRMRVKAVTVACNVSVEAFEA